MIDQVSNAVYILLESPITWGQTAGSTHSQSHGSGIFTSLSVDQNHVASIPTRTIKATKMAPKVNRTSPKLAPMWPSESTLNSGPSDFEVQLSQRPPATMEGQIKLANDPYQR